jgi:hypothetical protein
MTRRNLLLLLAAPAIAAAAPANLSGTWTLNVKESDWGRGMKAPQNIVIQVQHSEPKLRYQGEITPTLEAQSSTFTFDGAIDEKDYTVKEDNAELKMRFKRDNDYRITSTKTTSDGKTLETAVMVVSHDGKRLTRRITADTREGKKTWTEVYDKQ